MRRRQEAASFVVRIWLERRRNGDPAWRGHVQHVQSGEDRHFSRLTEMCAFLERMSGVGCNGLWAEKPAEAGLTR
ncbi:MAG: hypothetical protein H6901_01810 [Rhodobacteraceae bacterium]|nr:hypothetical protein [Paracoccaceae bacterium]MCP5340936.1 hypothetical protein [Paracoccaceae bacterium]